MKKIKEFFNNLNPIKKIGLFIVAAVILATLLYLGIDPANNFEALND